MVCSPDQLASNRLNAPKSKDSMSPEGRAKVARNSLKHGLTGAGIVVLDEDVAVIEDRFDDFNTNLNPLGVVSEFLLRHLVLQSVRMDRCARHEAACITRKMLIVRQAEQSEFQALVDRLAHQPEAACRELERSPRGVAWMIATWEGLQVSLNDPDPQLWDVPEVERAENLCGRRLVQSRSTRILYLSGVYHGHFDGLDGWPDLPEAGRRLAARDELARIMESEIARLKDVEAKLDHDGPAKRLALELFDASKEAVLARKYAAAAERAFFKTLKTIQELNAAAIAAASSEPDDATPETEKDSADLGLNFPKMDIPEGPPRKRPPAPADRPKSKRRRADRDPRRLKA